MITSLTLQNFKCFTDLRIELGKLTLLTGFNAGGKSSAVQPLLILAQNMRTNLEPDRFDLNGPLVRLGTAGDILPAASDSSKVTFTIRNATRELTWRFTASAGHRRLDLTETEDLYLSSEDRLQNQLGDESETSIRGQLAKLIYISAVRVGAPDIFPVPDSSDTHLVDVGADGGFAPFWFYRCADNEIPLSRRHPNETATSLRKQINAWLSTLFPGAQVNVQQIQLASLVSVQFRVSDIGEWRRPVNVGYGFTYVLPILVALLLAASGQPIVVDSPEAHLHPSAQSKMGEMLAHFAAAGVQIIVETHSDHLLNGARLAVKSGALNAEDLKLHFFTGSKLHEHGVVSPSLDDAGSIDFWPEGFFDQSELDLAKLSGWN